MLSTSTWIELVKERKSIGFGLRLGRSQAAIADPSQLKIFEGLKLSSRPLFTPLKSLTMISFLPFTVCPTLMSVESFFSSVEYRLGQLSLEEDDLQLIANINPSSPSSPGDLKTAAPVSVVSTSSSSSGVAGTAQKNIHGGFGAKTSSEAGSVIEGVAREDINGLMPLFIHEDHWKMAREDASPLFGWMTTLDVYGASADQIYTIPLVVLSSFLQPEKRRWSEIDAVLFLQLWRTCRGLILDCGTYFFFFLDFRSLNTYKCSLLLFLPLLSSRKKRNIT
jgi:hypothetical protein